MKKILSGKILINILFIILICTFIGCKSSPEGQLDIYPLSPFNDSVTFNKDEDVRPEMRNGIKIKYYLINQKVSFSSKFQTHLKDYIQTVLKPELTANKAIYFTFYKKSLDLDKDTQSTKAELQEKHANDKFIELEYINGKLYNYDYYQNGQYFVPDEKDPENQQ